MKHNSYDVFNKIKKPLMPNIKQTIVICALTLLSINSFALEWSPRLESAKQGEFREPMETFRIHINANVPVKILQSLSLELDNIDVTAMVSRKGEYAYFTPAQPLEWGAHVLRLVEYAEDGSILEKGYWQFEVRRSTVFQEVDYAADISLMATQRIADKNIGVPEQDGFTAQGSGAFQGRIADDDWEITGSLDLIYNSEQEQTTHNQEMDLGEFLISGQHQSNQINIGHHSLAQNSLVLEGFHRRGISASMGFDSINSAAAGFVLRSEEVIGFKQGLGVSDSNNTVNGVVWESQPVSDNPEQLYISATYLTGKSDKVGETVGVEQADQEGQAFSLLADSTLLDQQLRLRAEFASSSIDIITADITDTDIVNGKGDAMSFLASFNPQPISDDNQIYWNTGIEVSEVDSLFNSIANPNLPNDKTLNRIFLNLDWSGISTQLSSAKETDNVDEDASKPQIETRVNQLLLNYSLTEEPDENSLFYRIGTPSFSIQWSDTAQDQKKAATVITEDLDITNNMMMFAANFSKETWSWGWAYSEGEQIDNITPANNSISWTRDLNANIQINENLVITPAIQSQSTDTVFDNSSTDTNLYDIGFQLLVTDTITGQLNVNQSITDSDSAGNPQDTTISTASFQFSWNWIEAKNTQPGFDITLSGTYQDTQDSIAPGNNLETYQMFISLVMSLPLSSAE